MKSAFTRSAAAIFTLVAALFFLAVPSAKATPTAVAPYGTFNFSGYATISGDTFTYNPNDPVDDFTTNQSRSPWNGGTITAFTTNLDTVSSVNPEELFTLTTNGATLTFYLTSITSLTNAAAGSQGQFTGYGYYTDSLTGVTQYTGTISLTNSGTGAGDQNYSAVVIIGTPEPSALVLLGTGLLAMALVAGRKFRIA